MHPKTGKVCVPIDPAAAWDFDPDEVPTVQQLVAEMNQQQQQPKDGSGSAGVQEVRTALERHLLSNLSAMSLAA